MYANHFGGWLPRTDSSKRLLDCTRCTNPKSMAPKEIGARKAEGRFSAPAMSKPHVSGVLCIHVPKQISTPMSTLLLGVCKSVQALGR